MVEPGKLVGVEGIPEGWFTDFRHLLTPHESLTFRFSGEIVHTEWLGSFISFFFSSMREVSVDFPSLRESHR